MRHRRLRLRRLALPASRAATRSGARRRRRRRKRHLRRSASAHASAQPPTATLQVRPPRRRSRLACARPDLHATGGAAGLDVFRAGSAAARATAPQQPSASPAAASEQEARPHAASAVPTVAYASSPRAGCCASAQGAPHPRGRRRCACASALVRRPGAALRRATRAAGAPGGGALGRAHAGAAAGHPRHDGRP